MGTTHLRTLFSNVAAPLKTLGLPHTEIRSAGVNALLASPSVRTIVDLDIGVTTLTPIKANELLGGLPQLKTIQLPQPPLTPAGLDYDSAIRSVHRESAVQIFRSQNIQVKVKK